jgi:putative DNA primase/helicase
MAVASAKTVAAVERLAKADRATAASIEQWDTDDWLLNTPGGAVDLCTGIVRPHARTDYCTKITAVAAGGPCAEWLRFLEKITGADADLQSYLQRVGGYCLTGVTREHALFDGYGKGRNGKSVFLNTVASILGTYAISAPMETFTAAATDHHPTELARLNGARLVTSSETEQGRPWAESRIKALTGGDRIAARFVRADFFEFVPKFKLFVIGNHRPRLRSVDEAIRRRLHLIPFSVVISAEECDPELFDKLKAEWPGILQWMVQGCIAWQRVGLNPPAVVRDATADYLEAQDAVGQWLEECIRESSMGITPGSELFKSWAAWASARGENVGAQRGLLDEIEARGYRRARTGKSRGFRGIYVIARHHDTSSDPSDDGQ